MCWYDMVGMQHAQKWARGKAGEGDMQSLPLKLFISVLILSISNYGSLLLRLIASHLCIRTQLGFLNMYVQMHVL
jgi:hypothetical protein